MESIGHMAIVVVMPLDQLWDIIAMRHTLPLWSWKLSLSEIVLASA
jgi:hypothetical protein